MIAAAPSPERPAGVHGRDVWPSPVDPNVCWLSPAEADRLARRWWGEEPRDCEEDCLETCRYDCTGTVA